ncbi:MAG: hypothetical protein WCD27_03400, partial [Candidatus Acidiferrales bacterium]
KPETAKSNEDQGAGWKVAAIAPVCGHRRILLEARALRDIEVYDLLRGDTHRRPKIFQVT